MEEERVKYIVRIILEREDYFLIWGEDEDDIDRYATQDGKLLYWKSVDGLMKYAVNRQIKVDVEQYNVDTATIDLDEVAFWVKHPSKHIEPNMFINAWNHAGDLEATIPFGFHVYKGKWHKASNKIYDKLFWGLNLPVVTPEGRWYVPTWKHKEVLLLRDVMRLGITGFKSAFKNGISSLES